jgi:glycine dehydrogenase
MSSDSLDLHPSSDLSQSDSDPSYARFSSSAVFQNGNGSAANGSTQPVFGEAQGFERRHIGPSPADVEKMLEVLGFSSLEALIDQTIPPAIRLQKPLELSGGASEYEVLQELRAIATQNQIFHSFIGMGYSNCITPPVIQRNILENPGWYTQYTPYQPEIAQGRLEALLNFQTMVIDLTGLEIANASLLDEATAAAEAMTMSYGLHKGNAKAFWVSAACHPQTIDVIQTRAKPQGIEVIVGDHQTFEFDQPIFGALLQYPATDGTIYDYQEFIQQAHEAGALVTIAADLLSLTLLKPPGELGADIAVGNTQRFGVPLGYGGPGLLCHEGSVQAANSRTAGGRFQRCIGTTRAAISAANPRTAHSARQGDQQYLYSTGAASRDG